MNNEVGVLSVVTELTIPKAEKESGQFPSRLRLTADTCDSLKENIESGSIQVLVDRFNDQYQEVRQAVIAAETEAAEQQVRADVMAADEKAQQELEKEKALELAKIRVDQTIARASSVEVVVPKIARLNVEPSSTGAIFGKNDKGFVAPAVSGMVPKALMVPGNFAKIYSKIGKNVSLYKMADKIKESQPIPEQTAQSNSSLPEVTPVVVNVAQPVANWHSLFDGVVTEENSLQITPSTHERREEVEPIIPDQKGITKEELADRKVKAQIGAELADIRRLREGIAGTTPFNNGLVERENALLQMLSELTGIKVETRSVVDEKQAGITEFQKMVDSLIGYRDPITPEEHSKKEEEFEIYYSDPQVVETMWALQMKNRLYDMNRPEAHEIISAAERLDNERRASMSSAVEILDSVDVEPVVLKSSKPVAEEVVSFESPEILDGAKEQAKVLQAQNEQADLINGAEEQARVLQAQNEHADLVNGAEEQAKVLQAQNEHADLVNGAEEQARMLCSVTEQIDLTNGAEEQARMLQAQNEHADLINGAEEQAKVLHAQNEHADLINGAEEQAKVLQAQNEHVDLINGAEEQAKVLQAQNEHADLVNGAEEQARMLQAKAPSNKVSPVFNSDVFANARRVISGGTSSSATKEKKVEEPQKTPSNKSYVITDAVPRYVDMVSPSKPIKLNSSQIDRLRNNSAREISASLGNSESDSNVRDILMSLRTQLDELNVGVDVDEEIERPFSYI